jgi:hypothetical protein
VVGDLNGDGKPDVAAISLLSNVISLFGNVSTPGSFTTASLNPRVTFPGGGANPNQSYGIAIGDLTGDGRPDIVFANNFSNNISIYQNVVPLTSGGIPPSVTVEPVNQDVQVGGTTSFFVSARGSAMLSYQWFNRSGSILGATNSLLVLHNIQPSEAGAYYATVTNPYGSANSASANLTVNLPPATLSVVSTNGTAGAPVTVPINLVANGDENELSFSLSFDTNRLTYSSVTVGSGSGGAPFLANTNEAPNGELGIDMALPGGQTFNAGIYQIVLVTFNTSTLVGTQAVVSAIVFTSQPDPLFIVNTNDNSLSASYATGTVTLSNSPVVVVPTPSLNLSLVGGNYTISWPTSSFAFTLEAADCLTPPVIWTNVPVALEATNGGNVQVTLPTPDQQSFFRLSYP